MTAMLLALLLLAGYKVYNPAAPPTLKTPLVMTIRESVGMAPLTLRVKVRAEAEGREVCVVVDGPEYFKSCRMLDGITWTIQFILRSSGDYAVYSTSQQYRTPNVKVHVVGIESGDEWQLE